MTTFIVAQKEQSVMFLKADASTQELMNQLHGIANSRPHAWFVKPVYLRILQPDLAMAGFAVEMKAAANLLVFVPFPNVVASPKVSVAQMADAVSKVTGVIVMDVWLIPTT